MSRVDEAVARAAAMGTPAGDVDLHEGTPLPMLAEDLWEADSAPAEEAPSIDVPPDASPAEPLDGGGEREGKLVTQWNDPRSVEQYRRLAARLHLHQVERGAKVVMIGSAIPGEGKTLTAANLALTLSQSYQRQVLLIDGDLRRPWMHRLFRVPNMAGLNDGLASPSERKIPLIKWSDHLTLVTAGRPESDPMSVLSSERMKRIVAEAAQKFDWVIIDTPPVGLLTDAKLLAALVDSVILVVQAGRTPFYDIQKAVEALGRDAIFGVVLNQAQAPAQGYYHQYYYTYERQVAE